MAAQFKMKNFCPHCRRNSTSSYLFHHVYDKKQGSKWDGDADTIKEPAAYFVLNCQNCDHVLLYHYDIDDEWEAQGFLEYSTKNGIHYYDFGDENELKKYLVLTYPDSWEHIHKYVPLSVRSFFSKALTSIDSPEHFAIQLGKTLDEICKERRVTGKNLDERMKNLCEESKLPETVKDLAGKIRKIRNIGAHEWNGVRSEHVELIISFFRTLVNHIYVLPMQLLEWDLLSSE